MASQKSAPGDYGHFKLLQSFPIKYAPVTVSKWRSERTGLTVVVGEHSAPMTNGHFAIASEIFDDTGRPHTLEHLIFLGSKDYPYKGVLDHLANRAASNGTNAWTANDHTAYTIGTTGSEGFLNMLPIYVDHILHPTITDAGFVTEVHHINGKGEDSGVVYSEMQGRENQAGDQIALQIQRTLYPESSAYRSETGGLMANLRVLTAQQIRDYHQKYYVPHNLCLLIDGAVPLDDLFRVLNDKVDPLILSHIPPNQLIPPPEWKRPFVQTSTAKPLIISDSQTKVVEFMEEDESIGEVYFVFLGPSPIDYKTNLAIQVINRYLTSTATAPLKKEFVEIPKPLCTQIGFYSEDRVNKNEITGYAADVPYKHLHTIRDAIQAKLVKIVKEEGIDMDRIRMVIRRDKRQLLNSMERNTSGVLADCVIGDFLYGDADGKDMESMFDDLEQYAALDSWTADDWVKLLDQYLVSAPSLTFIGKPSAALSAKIEKDENERIAKRKEALGEEKLKELEAIMQKAKAESEVPPPPEMISDFPVTDPASLTWIPVETAICNAPGESLTADGGALQRHVDKDTSTLAYQAHFAHVESNFVLVNAAFDTAKISSNLRPYFSILSRAIFSLGLKRWDGSVLSFEQAVDQLADFTVSQNADFSVQGAFSEVFSVNLKVEKGDYEKGVRWIRDLITGVIFDKERLAVIVAKQIQELPTEKRDGRSVARAWVDRLTYDVEKSTSEATSLLTLLEFLPKVAEELKSSPDTVIQRLEEVRQYLLEPSIVRVSVRGNILSLPAPKETLAKSFITYQVSKPLQPLSTARETLTELGKNPSKKMIVIPMAAIEGSYSAHYAKGPAGWSHPDLPALRLSAAVLNASESYLWKSVRGAGLAYGASVRVDAESGLTSYHVYRSGDAREAYEVAGKLLVGLADGSVELDQNIVDGARSTETHAYAERSDTVAEAASTAYLNEVLKGIGKNADQEYLKVLPSITLDQIREMIGKYFLPIFDPSTAIGAVAVNSGKAGELEEGYQRIGFAVERKELPVLEGDETDDESGSASGSGSGSDSGGESGDEKSEDGMEDIRSP